MILPIRVPFSLYGKRMLGCDSMKVSAVAIDTQQLDDIYEAELDVALEDPALSIRVSQVFSRSITLAAKSPHHVYSLIWDDNGWPRDNNHPRYI